MARFSAEEVARVARLARLRLDEAEAARVAAEMEAVTDAFGDLAGFAATLPPEPAEAPAPLRDDEPETPTQADADALLAEAPRVDAASRCVKGPRGGA